ncbi:MAG: TIGR04255 family protein [Cyanobacteria bacterium J06635_1]
MEISNHYLKAPITEALLDLRVTVPPDVNLSSLLKIYKSIDEEYPHLENMLSFENNLIAAPVLTNQTKTSFTGFRFWSSDRRQICQARLDGFTFSRLAPYKDWDTLRDEARRLWDIYREFTKPQKIQRVAVRYINRLDIPLPIQDFSDYLRTIPQLSSDLPQELNDYLLQLRIPERDLGGWLSLREAILPTPIEENIVSIVLDIDLFCEVDLQANSNEYWELLEKIRVRKNQVFEACITDKTRELIK